jgi:hypothetical protein
MRRAIVVLGVVLVLVALDALFNQWAITGSIYRQALEFARLVDRLLTRGP